ncbi:MAG TPA: DNA methyltransferase [Azospirillaceae bacterium]|nr:DNA methyltransferase [Azospirillaceae bacterium]
MPHTIETQLYTTKSEPTSERLKVVYHPTSALQPHPRNPRTHGKKQIEQIRRSIERFGFTNPVLVDGEGRLIAGHGRVAAAKLLGMDRVPTIRLDHMTEAEVRAYALADNRLAELAGWDKQLLALELSYIAELDLTFDLTLTGFETADMDVMLVGDEADEEDEEHLLPPDDRPAVTRPGDLWQLGRHRILCGDATDAAAYARLMAGEPAQMVFTDPPYNVPIDGHVCGLGSVRHAEFAMASGEMSEDQFIGFLTTVCRHMAAHSRPGSIHFVCMDWRHLYEILVAGRAVYSELKNLCVWNKDNGGMGSFYRSKHELVLVFKSGAAAHINNFELGQHGRYRTNVWDYAGVNSLRPDRLDELRMHPTVKPVELVADAIRDCSHRGGVVLDPFAGSGTTIVAAEKTGRCARALEISPAYVDTAIRRWQALTGDTAVHVETGEPFQAREQELNADEENSHG